LGVEGVAALVKEVEWEKEEEMEKEAAKVKGAEPATVAVSGTEVATAAAEGAGTGVVTEALPAAEKRLASSPDTHPSFQGCSC
jgi:hypothetical protein